jgi:hypothetical protein
VQVGIAIISRSFNGHEVPGNALDSAGADRHQPSHYNQVPLYQFIGWDNPLYVSQITIIAKSLTWTGALISLPFDIEFFPLFDVHSP